MKAPNPVKDRGFMLFIALREKYMRDPLWRENMCLYIKRADI